MPTSPQTLVPSSHPLLPRKGHASGCQLLSEIPRALNAPSRKPASWLPRRPRLLPPLLKPPGTRPVRELSVSRERNRMIRLLHIHHESPTQPPSSLPRLLHPS